MDSKNTLGRGRRNTKGNRPLTPASGSGGGRAKAKAAPKIENMEIVAASKANMMLVTLENIQNALSKQILEADGLFKDNGREDVTKLHTSMIGFHHSLFPHCYESSLPGFLSLDPDMDLSISDLISSRS